MRAAAEIEGTGGRSILNVPIEPGRLAEPIINAGDFTEPDENARVLHIALDVSGLAWANLKTTTTTKGSANLALVAGIGIGDPVPSHERFDQTPHRFSVTKLGKRDSRSTDDRRTVVVRIEVSHEEAL